LAFFFGLIVFVAFFASDNLSANVFAIIFYQPFSFFSLVLVS
tara:strand:+ start:331 stop:456 length:126 start_codon:yes stop_codon:yes gene_type:complete